MVPYTLVTITQIIGVHRHNQRHILSTKYCIEELNAILHQYDTIEKHYDKTIVYL
jgi:hypothetical protein